MRIRKWRYFDEFYQDRIELSYSSASEKGNPADAGIWIISVVIGSREIDARRYFSEELALSFFENYQPPQD